MKEMEKQIDMNARWENLGISNDLDRKSTRLNSSHL